MAIKTFDPPIGPSFEFTISGKRPQESTPSIKGWEQRRPTGIWELRVATLAWKSLSQTELDYILSFFCTLKDDSGDYAADSPFYWTPPKAVMAPEGDSPKLEQVSGGSLNLRTYYVGYTWRNNTLSQETTMSASASLAISTNYICKVTLPIYPPEVDRTRVYATSGAEGTEKLEATLSGARTWTEATTGLVGSGAAPPSTNNLKPPIKWVLQGDRIPRTMISAARWRCGPLTFVEQWI
jgi:hypothetical protein